MKRIIIIVGVLLFINVSSLCAQQLIDVEIGLSSYVGGYYYQNNTKKDFEYKSNHNWYLNLSKEINEQISTSAEIRYYPELFDKQLYLYSAKVAYLSDSQFEISWQFDRIGLGKENQIFKNILNTVRSDQNFITDYRFNGAVVKHKLFENIFVEYRVGGNDLNTGLGGIEFSLDQKGFKVQQTFLMVSRDNRYNAKAFNINNAIRFETDKFMIQNMFHNSYTDYYRNYCDEKSTIIKDMIETKFSLTSFLQPQFSFYYEAENWDKFKIYETNSIINILFDNYEVSPAFKFVDYQNSIQREYSLLLNYHIHEKWDVGLVTKYIDTKNNQGIISYGLQTKFNLPLNSHSLKSLLK